MTALSNLAKFAKRKYRDNYLQTQVRSRIAYQIQALRSKFGLTQAEFAERTGKKQSTISRLESTEYGKVSVQTLLDIASALDVALVVKFASYPDFLKEMGSVVERDLQPDTIIESLNRASRISVERGPAEKMALSSIAQIWTQTPAVLDDNMMPHVHRPAQLQALQ